jgi:hypothetical protein
VRSFADLLYWVIVVAIIYSLVRPGSPAGKAMTTIADAAVDVIGTATGYVQRGG